MDISVYFFGKKSAINELEKVLLKRLNHHWRVQIIPLQHSTKSTAALCKAEELERLQQKRDARVPLVVLDKSGNQYTSEELAAWTQNTLEHIRALHFVIGGSYGLDEKILDEAALIVSFGKCTWTHDLARLMTLEQLYRTQQIILGTQYHK